MSSVVVSIIALVAGGAAGAVLAWLKLRAQHGALSTRTEQLQREAEEEKQRLLLRAELDAKSSLLHMQQEAERELKQRREELASHEKRIRQRESGLERRTEELERREREFKQRESGMDAAEQRAKDQLKQAEGRLDEARRELERVAGLSQAEAKQELLATVEQQARAEAAARVKRIEEEARKEAAERSARILATAIQRYAGEFVAEKTVSVVELPSDDMKGRIIGREGRNIRALEAATGVDVIIDDTPEAVILSGFNPVRREIAKLSLERLVTDGRIHPARIEEVVERVAGEIDEAIWKAGEQAVLLLGLHGMHSELIKLVGKLKYRLVEGQSGLSHSVETASIAGMLAAELGADVGLAKRAGLLHDLGKAIDHETEGEHAAVGADAARRFGEKGAVIEAIRCHHDASPPTVLAVLVQAANVVSKARPGARREAMETYVRRLQELERIPMGFRGVERAYAIQAGREVRVMVSFAEVNDAEALLLSQDIARRIQDEMTYPGEVRVTVVRETRVTEIAR